MVARQGHFYQKIFYNILCNNNSKFHKRSACLNTVKTSYTPAIIITFAAMISDSYMHFYPGWHITIPVKTGHTTITRFGHIVANGHVQYVGLYM